MIVVDTIRLYYRYLTDSLPRILIEPLTKSKLKESNFPSLKKSVRISGTNFGFNFRLNELRDDFDKSFEYMIKFKVEWIRVDFPMGYYYKPDFRFADKIVSECQKRKIKLMFVLGSGMSSTPVNTPKNEREANKFVELVAKIARRYKSKVNAYEIWNEPNLRYFWNGSFKDFIELLKRSSFNIKKETNSLVGFDLKHFLGFNRYFKKFASREALRNIDFFGMHGYPGTIEPGDYKTYGKRISDIKKILKDANCNIQIFVTEVGFVSFNSPSLTFHTPENQTKFLIEACKIFKKNKIPLVIWYRMRDAKVIVPSQKNEPYENNFGLLKKNFKPKNPKIFEIIQKKMMFK